MEVSGSPDVVATRRLHVVPLNTYELPVPSMAMQNVVPTQETSVRPVRLGPSLPSAAPDGAVGLVTWVGPLHDVPFQMKASSLLSTATQYTVLVQETALSCPVVSTSCGWLQAEPSHNDGPPSAAMQNVGVVHDTLLASPHAPVFPDHCDPSKVNTFPSPSMVTQKVGPTHEMAWSP